MDIKTLIEENNRIVGNVKLGQFIVADSDGNLYKVTIRNVCNLSNLVYKKASINNKKLFKKGFFIDDSGRVPKLKKYIDQTKESIPENDDDLLG